MDEMTCWSSFWFIETGQCEDWEKKPLKKPLKNKQNKKLMTGSNFGLNNMERMDPSHLVSAAQAAAAGVMVWDFQAC